MEFAMASALLAISLSPMTYAFCNASGDSIHHWQNFINLTPYNRYKGPKKVCTLLKLPQDWASMTVQLQQLPCMQHHTMHLPHEISQPGETLESVSHHAEERFALSKTLAERNKNANQLQLKKAKSAACFTGVGDSSFEADGSSVNISIRSRTSYLLDRLLLPPILFKVKMAFVEYMVRWKSLRWI